MMRFPLLLVALICVTADNAAIPKPDLYQQYQGRFGDIVVADPNRMDARPPISFNERDTVEKQAYDPNVRESREINHTESAQQQRLTHKIAQPIDNEQKMVPEQQRRPRRHVPRRAPTKWVYHRQQQQQQQQQQARAIPVVAVQTNKSQPQQQMAHNRLRVSRAHRESKPVRVENATLTRFHQTLAGQATATQQPILSQMNPASSQSDFESLPPEVHLTEEESRSLVSFVVSRPSSVPSSSPSRPIVSPAGVQYYGNTDATTGPWPECVGWEGHDCKAYIETITTDHPNVMVIGAEAIYDFHRVKVLTSVEGLVIKAPERG